LKINKYCYLLHPVGLGFITLPTLKMHGQTQIRFFYVCINVGLQTVRLKLYYPHYCYRRSTAACDTAVPVGQHAIPEAAEVTVEFPGKFNARREKTTCCRYGNVLYHIGLKRLLLFNRELLDCFFTFM
jgi:hypothetical protein